MIDLALLSIERIIVHHIPPRADDRSFVAPEMRDHTLTLSQAGLDMFAKRISQALGHHSHGVQAEFHNTEPQSFFVQLSGFDGWERCYVHSEFRRRGQ